MQNDSNYPPVPLHSSFGASLAPKVHSAAFPSNYNLVVRFGFPYSRVKKKGIPKSRRVVGSLFMESTSPWQCKH